MTWGISSVGRKQDHQPGGLRTPRNSCLPGYSSIGHPITSGNIRVCLTVCMKERKDRITTPDLHTLPEKRSQICQFSISEDHRACII
jgi:hypothetical protein